MISSEPKFHLRMIAVELAINPFCLFPSQDPTQRTSSANPADVASPPTTPSRSMHVLLVPRLWKADLPPISSTDPPSSTLDP
ncbi:hypothetical protein WAI453_001559 [Rhynchosporium graminicola]